ncbi:MAG: hypothetical protein WAV89_00900 [Ignavibacteriaceae bacterium]
MKKLKKSSLEINYKKIVYAEVRRWIAIKFFSLFQEVKYFLLIER